ncbi:uncharacterized protein GGS22DRAFT_3105 [Annulohypoxylon maeteangense]|uniref:uncharacterized protein n=1 Tax=Annulohypoxylon maeteangense TaxID=1927788 RepID=UPI002007EBCD|nr:uncharacterized protein GGS22DRAFT_3105 [Annulohypoxylon maeteangense]KAI0889712.1 hypothetical protein GGS22DRAFT_3105 [Annulohypoxylon maeteangense]
MPAQKHLSDNIPPTGRVSESERENGEEHYYTRSHTEYRPPHLNGDNFSSTQPSGYNTQPRRVKSIETDDAIPESVHVTDGAGDYTYQPYADSTTYTESTLRGRRYLHHILNHDYFNYDGNGSARLTTQAIDTLNHNNENGYQGNVHDWEMGYNVNYPAGLPVDFHADSGFDLSTGNLEGSSAPQSQASVMSSNYVMVPPAPEDPLADIIRDAGAHLNDISTPQTSFASDIADADTR